VSTVQAPSGRREFSDDEIVLGVLDAVERDQHVTQRLVASELGIALGLANAYLKRCVRKGLVKVSQVPRRRYAYYLTPQGFAEKSRLTASYLAHSLSFFRNARSQLAAIFVEASARGHRRLALLGDGDLAEIALLVAREGCVEIAGVVKRPLSDTDPLLLGVEGVLITDLVDPRTAYDTAIERFEALRVYTPAVLRLQSHRANREGRAQ
jgi:DNA-binding MarR family transcriptional regulator